MKTAQVFLSGVVVYLSVATIHACGGSVPSPTFASSSSAMGGAGGSGGSGGAGGAKASASSGAGGSMTNPVGDALADSGSRLKAQWIAGDDGSKFFNGIYDSKRNEDCQFLPMIDGKSHCVPAYSSLYLFDPPYAVPEYIDANCMIRVASSAKYACKKSPAYVHLTPDPSCPTYDFLIVAPMLTPAIVYKKTNNTCVASPPEANADYYSIGAHVDPSEFVVSTIVTDP